MYTYAKKIIQLYSRLQDELSQSIFWARLQFEAEPNMDRAIRLYEIGSGRHIAWRGQMDSATANGKKIVLYGAGGRGELIAKRLMRSHMDFFAFCDQKEAGKAVMGKPVLPPQELINYPDQYAVAITTSLYYEEIFHFLLENGFPADSILPCFGLELVADDLTRYREFPELFKAGTAIVDAGCFDGEDTIQFARWCAGAYSRIYAFEPDEANYRHCQRNIETSNVPNVSLYKAGLSESKGKLDFASSLGSSSYLIGSTEKTSNTPLPHSESATVQVYALDDLADVEIGLIKMDIEGAEFDALHGAKQIIRRDKPQMAICVYHRQGDMLAIMDYLQSLVPEYRFWLRHFGPLDTETLLYAAI